MLDETFHLEFWFEDESPWLEEGEELDASACVRDRLDDNLNLYQDANAIGIFNMDGDLVGYPPDEVSEKIRAARRGGKGVYLEVASSYDESLYQPPLIRLTSS